jgi:branched-chain amino acid aminotransferase
MKLVFFNGRLLPEEEAHISIFDRSLLYADGLFETMRVYQGRPFRWGQHLQRLQSGAAFLGITLPHSPALLHQHALALIRLASRNECILRVHLSRGVGKRGYSPADAHAPWFSMSLDEIPPLDGPSPQPRRLVISSFRVLVDDPLAAFKTCNKLVHVCGRAEADHQGADEALLLNTRGEVAEATAANILWLEGRRLLTPPLSSGALPGVSKAVLSEVAVRLGLSVEQTPATPERLQKAGAVFLSLTSWGVVEVDRLGECNLPRSPLFSLLLEGYRAVVRNETGPRRHNHCEAAATPANASPDGMTT